eukprot:scaffold234290_cov33-Tisochrysis_lutea.AAC.2
MLHWNGECPPSDGREAQMTNANDKHHVQRRAAEQQLLPRHSEHFRRHGRKPRRIFFSRACGSRKICDRASK